MISTIKKHKKLIKRFFITLFLIMLFRFGSLITVPGFEVNQESISQMNQGSFLGILNLIGGGGLTTFSIFALGITPYITASIIVQLLSTDVIPFLGNLNKKGEKGRIKLEKITRIIALILAIIQVLAISLSMISLGYVETTIEMSDLQQFFLIVIVMTSGSMISIWIADHITMKGIGNGTSLIIVSGIVTRTPYKYINAWSIMVNPENVKLFIGFITFFIYIIASILIIFALSFFETSQRKIPIQQTGKGLNLTEGKETYLPIKINPAGVVPVIFASAFLTLPPTIMQFFPDSYSKQWVTDNFALTSYFGLSIYAVLIVLFSFFYAQINISPEKISEDFKKSSTFIVGVKPGEDTRAYLSGVINSVTSMGALVLMLLSIFPYLLTFLGMPQSITFGGTSMIIMVSSSIDTVDQIKSRIISENTKSQAKIIDKINKSDNKNIIEEEENILFK